MGIQLLTEHALRAERQRLYDVLETLPAYVILLTPDYRISFANKFFRERFGEDHGRKCFEYLFNRIEPCEICETYKVLKTMAPHRWEWTGPDGRNYDIHDFPFTDTNGSTLILEMGIDVTDRKQAEEELRHHKEHLEDLVKERTAELGSRNAELAAEMAEKRRTEAALRESEERYRRLFESIQENFVVQEVLVDHTGKPVDLRYIEVNPAMERLLGRSRLDVIGRTRGEVVGQPDPELIESVGRVALTGNPVRVERYSHAVERWFECFSYSFRPGQVATLALDITEHKRAEEVLRKAHDELEIRVRERTDELERRNQELQEFVFVASHDLREPLRKIQTFGDLLAKKSGEALTDDGRDYIHRMQRAAARMQTLLASLLGYSRLATHAEPFQSTNLALSLKLALSNLEVVVAERKARIEVGPMPVLEADRVQMVQLFQNLIANALKFQGGTQIPHVRIYAQAIEGKSGSQSVWQICVEDNGIGFDEVYLDKMFKPFQRLHGYDEYEGVGIGLAICRKIAERHGGKITAKSTVGKGSTFIVTLPLKRVPRRGAGSGRAE